MRPIRSYVLRQGRMTRAQQLALDTLWQRYGVEPQAAPLDFDALFGRRAPRVLEIGFGAGDALLAAAAAHPENDYLGIEVHRPGVGSLLRRLDAQGIANVRVICHDAVEVLQRAIPDASLSAVHVFFPDPWPKRRHHKRRLVQPAFAELAAHKLKSGGRLHLATDDEDYAQYMMHVLTNCLYLKNVHGSGVFADAAQRFPSRFEQRALGADRRVWDLVFEG
ncbi:MAG: tRNA (guanosine(46)-N7)-methyltransferase TrmB [Gammaproteobacteria bacterium]|nr:tRNA (guanosine(46)-N7)-methyltransferase TrmB [Gammaproteobacteria bacterium]